MVDEFEQASVPGAEGECHVATLPSQLCQRAVRAAIGGRTSCKQNASKPTQQGLHERARNLA